MGWAQAWIAECEECLKEESVYEEDVLPDGWLYVSEGPGSYSGATFCSGKCVAEHYKG